MTRFRKREDGKYHIHGKVHEKVEGTRAEVWHGTAYKTAGDLTKTHLLKNKHGRIVSKKKHTTARKEKRLVKAGYGATKGKFGYVLLNNKSRRSSRRKSLKGGMIDLSPAPYDGRGVGTSGAGLQVMATQFS